MAINKYLRMFIVAFFLSATIPLWAQNTGYFVELRFVQRLRWTSDEYAMRYEVIIEKEEAREYRRFFQGLTEANFIDVSLSPGKYRYQVIPHDFFDLPIPVSDWVEFEVRPGDDQLITGEHEIIIVNSGDESSRKEIILAVPGTATVPETVSAPETVTVSEIVTTSETATAAEAETITEYIRQFDIYFGTALTPLLPLYGENRFFGENISPFGMSARFYAVSAKQNFLNPGIELTASWRVYGSGTGQAVHSTAFYLNILAQTRFPGGNTALNLRAGAGLSLLPKTQSVSPNGQYSFHVNIGASFLWLFMKNFHMEFGVEYSQFFTEDYFGFFRPWIGFGYRF
jgi:hypothetical protein